ncbi:MAG: glycosyltransferase family 4 protein [Fimbriimonadaceae bacterium]|nr:glycosyltransferase family 4 protein [Fimbriimonadaceae bacterium]
MRVLGLRRRLGGAALMADAWAESLESHGIELVVDDVRAWMPDETGRKADKPVTKRLKDEVRGFDLVHALSYRAAWACSEALYVRSPWVYSAFDFPFTRHNDLVDRLNAARLGLCTTRTLRRHLDSADVLHMTTVDPPVPVPIARPSKEEARRMLGVPNEGFVIGGVGRWARERGFDDLIDAMDVVNQTFPHATLIIAGAGEDAALLRRRADAEGRKVILRDGFDDRWMVYQACDLLVVNSPRQAFSYPMAEAMRCGRCVMIRRDSGLEDVVSSGSTGMIHDPDLELGYTLVTALSRPDQLEAIGQSAQRDADLRFDVKASADRLARLYREAVGTSTALGSTQ